MFRTGFSLILIGCFLSGCVSLVRSKDKSRVQEYNVPFDARSTPDSEIRKRVIILPFLNETLEKSEKIPTQARRTVLRNLVATNEFVVINYNDLPQGMSHYRGEEGYNLEKLAKEAAAMGVQAVIEGRILNLDSKRERESVGVFRQVTVKMETAIRIRMIATKNAKVIFDEVRTAGIESVTSVGSGKKHAHQNTNPRLIHEVVTKAFRGVIHKMISGLNKLSWEGRIALVTGDRIYLNAGRLSGIQVGDILKVTEEGPDVFDPDTGALLGKVPGRMKGTVEVISYFGKDGAVSIVHSGSGFSENDRVELY